MADSERLGEPWQIWTCSDCDPGHADDSTDEVTYDRSYVMMLPMGDAAPDYCPRCGAYLSMCEGARDLRITNTPAERYAARRATR